MTPSPSQRRHLLGFVALAGMLSCASVNSAGATDSTPDGDADAHSSADATFGPTSEPTPDSSAGERFFSLTGTVVLVGGAVDVDASILRIALWSNDEIQQATLSPTLIGATSVVPRPPNVWAWWNVSLGGATTTGPAAASVSDSAASPSPTTPTPPVTPPFAEVLVGLGRYDDELNAAVSRRGWSERSLYGLYVQPPNEDVLVVGVAGTDEDFGTTSDTAKSTPIEDGSYELETLYLIDL